MTFETRNLEHKIQLVTSVYNTWLYDVNTMLMI